MDEEKSIEIGKFDSSNGRLDRIRDPLPILPTSARPTHFDRRMPLGRCAPRSGR